MRIKSFRIFLFLLVIAYLGISCKGGVSTPPSSPTAPAPTATAQPITPPASPSPGVISPPSPAISREIAFDFDSGAPVFHTGQSTPFSQTSGGLTATFSSPADPAAFSIQNHDTTFLTLSQFSRNYLYQNRPSRTPLHTKFSQPVTSITLTFATTDYHGVGEVEEPTAIKLTAYMNTAEITSLGSATARGTFPENYLYPQGTLSYSGRGAFNLVVIELLFQPRGASSFFADNVVVTTSL